jgi:hypothetical protein
MRNERRVSIDNRLPCRHGRSYKLLPGQIGFLIPLATIGLLAIGRGPTYRMEIVPSGGEVNSFGARIQLSRGAIANGP